MSTPIFIAGVFQSPSLVVLGLRACWLLSLPQCSPL
jgi:hypothetical protein